MGEFPFGSPFVPSSGRPGAPISKWYKAASCYTAFPPTPVNLYFPQFQLQHGRRRGKAGFGGLRRSSMFTVIHKGLHMCKRLKKKELGGSCSQASGTIRHVVPAPLAAATVTENISLVSRTHTQSLHLSYFPCFKTICVALPLDKKDDSKRILMAWSS